MKSNKIINLVVSLVVVGFMSGSCGSKGGDKGGGPGNMMPPNNGPSGCNKDGCPQPGNRLMVNIQGALGLLVVDKSQGSALALHNDTVKKLGLNAPTFKLHEMAKFGLTEEDASDTGLKKVDSNGEVTDAVTQIKDPAKENMGPKPQPLPAIRTIAVSKQREIFLHFERPFIYKDVPPGVDGWSQSNGYQCQIFKVKGGTLDQLITAAPSAENLECLDNLHFIDGWQAQRNSVFQFDDAGNLFYPGALPQAGGKMVVYKRAASNGTISEMINSNIQVNDFIVTPGGSMFYTGQTANNNRGGGSGFFRFISPTGSLLEIARNWWNFIYEPEQTSGTDKALFFGPDPSLATTASWNTACLFEFNPNAANTADDPRSVPMITCGGDIWRWVNMDRPEDRANSDYYPRAPTGHNMEKLTFRTEYKRRCESSGDVFAGGGSQISAIKQAGTETYVIGNVRKKKGGTYTCNPQIKGPHCVIANIPYLKDKHDNTTLYDSTTCAADNGQWIDKGGRCNVVTNTNPPFTQWPDGKTTQDLCFSTAKTDISGCGNGCEIGTYNYDYSEQVSYNNVASPLCTDPAGIENIWNNSAESQVIASKTGSTITAAVSKFNPGWSNCEAPASSGGGDNWTEELSALAKVVPATKTLQLLSNATDQAINVWAIGTDVFYSAFDVTKSQYVLRKIVNNAPVTVKENFETYQLGKSPEAGKGFINGLDFASNQFVFGSLDLTTPFNVSVKPGVTGQVRTIIVINE